MIYRFLARKKKLHKAFRLKQLDLKSLLDSSYSWMVKFDKSKIYYIDNLFILWIMN